MKDFAKIIAKNLTPSILEANPLLNFCSEVNITTGEVRTENRNGTKITPHKKAFYHGLEFKIYENGTITIEGSLHKYWNEGMHNYNDFDHKAFTEVLIDLKAKFGIDPEQSIIKCLEIGINIVPPVPTLDILDYCFLHSKKPFEYKYNSDEGRFKQVKHSQYIIKLYDKALHYRSKGYQIDNEIMRFEIKYTKMEKLNKLGIFNLNDLVNFDYENFKEMIIKEWNSILFYDKTTKSDSKLLLKYQNPIYWNEMIKHKSDSLYRKHRNQLQQLTLSSSDRIQNQLTEIMEKKIDSLKGTNFDT